MMAEESLLKKRLIDFESKIVSLYKDGKIRAPVHLAGNNEENLIKIFKSIKKDDWVCTSYRNHYHALLKGIPEEWIEKRILDGASMFLMNKEYKFLSSAIVPGQLPIALGIAQALKLKKSKNAVWAFCGDMAAETGVFHEVLKYARGHNLPINFIVEDDGLSVYTPTKEVWANSIFNGQEKHGEIKEYCSPKAKQEKSNMEHFLRYEYNRKWPHHGIGLWIKFKEEKEKKRKYIDEISKAMELVAKKENSIFIGQTTCYRGSPVYGTLKNVPLEKRIEVPIMEEVQMGIATGLSLEGYMPVNIYPRFDFLILATNQLVNHLDKIEQMSAGEFKPKMIIRTAVGSKSPLDGGPQHTQDHTEAYKKMLTNIDVVKLRNKKQILPAYKKALLSEKSTIIVELADLYNK